MATVGRDVVVAQPTAHIGAMIAGNSGRPGGAVGEPGDVAHDKIHAGHSTQEEDMVSTWLLSECGGGNRDSGRWREEASAV